MSRYIGLGCEVGVDLLVFSLSLLLVIATRGIVFTRTNAQTSAHLELRNVGATRGRIGMRRTMGDGKVSR